MTRYSPSRSYIVASVAAAVLGVSCTWFAVRWQPAILAVGLFIATAAVLLYLALRPVIEIEEESLVIGRRRISWNDIERVDRTGWISPLIAHLTLSGGQRLLLVYPGDLDSANSLLRHLRRFAKNALIDGIPHNQFWGEEVIGTGEEEKSQSPPSGMLSKEDEEEVERLYQRLKTVGHLDSANPTDEK